MRDGSFRLPIAALCCVLFSIPVMGQAALGGPGAISLPGIDTEAATGANSNLGVQYHAPTNTIFVSGRGNVTGGVYANTPPHTLWQLDLAGNVINSVTQPNMTSVWGHRDGATDGNLIFFGDEMGTWCFDPTTGAYEATPAVLTALGPQIATFPIPLPAGVTNVRGLCYNPAGNGGNGSFWTGNFATAIIEFDLSGNILTTWPTNGNWSVYGLAWDPVRNMLWANSSPANGDIVEIDPTTGTETGNRIVRVNSSSAQGGLCFMQRPGAGSGGIPSSELLGLDQAAPDIAVGYRLDLYTPTTTRGYWDEIRVETSVNGSPFDTLPKTFTDGDTISWRYAPGPQQGTNPGIPAGLLLSLGAEAQGTADTLGFPEFVTFNSLSTPASVGLTFTLGDGLGLGSLLAPSLGPIGPNLTSDPAPAFPWPAGSGFANGDALRMQAIVVDNGIYGAANPFGLLATNTVFFNYLDPTCYREGFEGLPLGAASYPTGWSNGPGGSAGGVDQWQVRTGGTPSGGTGPAGANTGLQYMYCEASGAANTWPKTYVMDTGALNTCGLAAPTLEFSFHLFGATSGTFMVEELDAMGNPTNVLFTITGDQGDVWTPVSVPLTPAATASLRFTYVTPIANNSWQGDCCIDDVVIR